MSYLFSHSVNLYKYHAHIHSQIFVGTSLYLSNKLGQIFKLGKERHLLNLKKKQFNKIKYKNLRVYGIFKMKK